MSSALPRSVAADSNVLLAAVARRAAWRVFEAADLMVVTTEVTIAEVKEYAPEFAARYNLDLALVREAIELLPIERYDETAYATKLDEASRLIRWRDPDDIHLAASRFN